MLMTWRSTGLVGAVLAIFFAAAHLACTPPEVRACEFFVDELAICTDRNASAGEPPEDLCEEVHPECEDFFRCAANRPCVKDPVGYTLDITACALPDGISCP
ncbi:MAG: hypothetical protein IPK80_21885 [Nannocystis sp.]|nr:hypothetical protein [Nannocystis sp.]